MHVRWTNRSLMILAVALVLGGLALLLYFPRVQLVLVGFLRGEAFYNGRPTSYWVSALKKEPTFLGQSLPQGDIGKMLREGGPDAIPVLVQMLGDEENAVTQEALLALTLMDPDPALVKPALEQILQTRGEIGCLQGATQLLQRLDRAAAQATLIRALESNRRVRGRVWAASAVGTSDDDERSVATALERCIRNPAEDMLVRLSAIRGLIRLQEPISESMMALLCAGILSPDRELRVFAFLVLQDLGPHAQSALPTLQESLADEDPDTRIAALNVLGRIGPEPEIIQLLIVALRDPYVAVRNTAIAVLRRFGPKARDAVPALVALLQDPRLHSVTESERLTDELGPWPAARALGAIGAEARPAVPQLLRALADRNLDIREAAAAALRRIDPEAAARAGVPLRDPAWIQWPRREGRMEK